jgi:hypothetical protein
VSARSKTSKVAGTRTQGSKVGTKGAGKGGTRGKAQAMHKGGRGGGGRGGGGGGGHHGGRHHRGDRGYGHRYGCGGSYYPRCGWYFGFGWGLGWGGWFSPWFWYWDFPGYWAWYWPGFALSVFYAGLYNPQPSVVVLGQDRVNYYAVYERSDDGYVKTGQTDRIDPDVKKTITIDNRDNNIIIVAKDKKDLRDTIYENEVKSKDNYSVIDPTEAPDKQEKGDPSEVTDEKIAEFQKTVKERSNELEEKAETAANTDTSEAEEEAKAWEAQEKTKRITRMPEKPTKLKTIEAE